MDWVRKTWDDIKGNAKWAALLAVVSAIVWLMHGLVWWKQGGLLAVAVVIGWLMYRIGLDRVKQPRSGNLGPIATLADSRVEFHDLVPKHESHTKLEVRFSPNEPYHFREFHGMTHHRMGIYNSGSVVAENVEVFLTLVTPRPLCLLFPADYPYRVRRESSPVVETAGCRINPRHEELFEFAKSYVSSDMNVRVDGMDTKNERGRNPIPIEKNEYWHLKYKITCANAEPESAVFFVHRKDDDVVMERI